MPHFATECGPIHFEQYGSRADAPLLLVNGFGQQIPHWPPSLVGGLVDAGLRVIAFDNRDAGLSFGSDATPFGALFPAAGDLAESEPAGDTAPPYRLADMAEDAIRLLDHLGQAGAHLVGFSLGGMIAQRLAIGHPERVFSLTSISSSAGPFPMPEAPEIRAAMNELTATQDEAASVARTNLLGGPHHDSASVGFGRFERAAFARAHRPDGMARQLQAAIADGDRRPALAKVRVPALVVHGDADPLFPPEEGRHTATAIPGATLHIIPTMGHDLPEPLIGQVVAHIVALVRSANVKR